MDFAGVTAGGNINITFAARQQEKEVVNGLLVFLEDRRLLTDETGYTSHFPDHLRKSAADIRAKTNVALQKIDRRSELVPILRRIQTAARKFEEATEGAMDGQRAGGGLTPYLPMGLKPYLNSLYEYREEIGSGMLEAADMFDLRLDPQFIDGFMSERGRPNWWDSLP